MSARARRYERFVARTKRSLACHHNFGLHASEHMHPRSAPMKAKRMLTRLLAAAVYGTARTIAPAVYAQDGLLSVHCHDFLQDPAFKRAYERGVAAIGGVDNYHWHWRIHVGLWVAFSASKLEGDFVECGVNRGFLSSAIMEYLDWDSLSKTFYLLDTFSGLDKRFVSDEEVRRGALDQNALRLKNAFYVSGVDSVRSNFSRWRNVRIVPGAIPETLKMVEAKKLAYLHLDMNCAPPEIAAATFFWDRLVPGAFVLLDDYAYFGFRSQKLAMDKFAAENGVKICSLPTGQGLLVKPPQ
jgi:hypothetical protein